MVKIRRIDSKAPDSHRRPRVAAYARVSMETERLAHSLSAQISYYDKLIADHPEWEFAGVYVDSGVSGTRVDRRDGFQRLLADCEAGKIDIVLTKSISRFARNTVDLLSTVRHLKETGVEVWFEKERIQSFSGEGELLLSVLASFAQEEVRSLSQNSSWGIRKTYQRGTDGVRNKKVLGYRYDGEKYVIKEDEAEIVRFLFEQTVTGKAPSRLIRELRERGAKSWKGNAFTYGSINAILKNEIYMGDRRLQKYYVEDFVRHNKKKNRGELPQYYMPDCHEPIISREIFAKVQEILNKRSDRIVKYPFTGTIRCGVCGNLYTRKKARAGGREYIYWICQSRKKTVLSCSGVNLAEKELEQISADILGQNMFEQADFAEQIREITVLEDKRLIYCFRDGKIKQWQGLCPCPENRPQTKKRAGKNKI